jgi:hypothetical protein
MTYELAQQLKNAGFPRPESDTGWGRDVSKPDGYFPTLSELIEACMELMKPTEQFPTHYNFFSLYPLLNTTQSGGGKELGDIEEWGAGLEYGPSLDDIESRRNYFGKTPEEAVAKLWIELNK